MTIKSLIAITLLVAASYMGFAAPAFADTAPATGGVSGTGTGAGVTLTCPSGGPLIAGITSTSTGVQLNNCI